MEKLSAMARGFITALTSGKIGFSITPDPNNEIEQELTLNYEVQPTGPSLSAMMARMFPEVWDVQYYGIATDHCLIYRTNELITQFVSYNAGAYNGRHCLGKLKTTEGVINVENGWSSRPGIVYKYTGIKLLEIIVGSGRYYLNYEVAEVVAELCGLVIVESVSGRGELSWVFHKKDTLIQKTRKQVNKTRESHIGIYESMGGWKALCRVWNEKGFWDVGDTGICSWATKEEAIKDAKGWAKDDAMAYVG